MWNGGREIFVNAEGVGRVRDGLCRRIASALLTFWTALVLTSCGAPGIPQPPSLHLPQPVTDLRAVRKGEKVQLTWTAPARTTDQQTLRQLGVTEICRGETAPLTQCGTPTGEVPAPAMAAANAEQGRKITQGFLDTLPTTWMKNEAAAQITYAVETLNTNRRSAGLSNQVSVPAAATLPPPENLRVKTTAEGVEVSASSSAAPAAVPGIRYFYRIYRREKGSDTSAVAGEEPWSESLNHLDRAFTWEKTYLYRVTIVTAIARAQPPEAMVEGDDSAEVEVFAHDVFPPAVPTGLQAVFSGEAQRSVDLVWSPDADADLEGYNVYRSEDNGAAVKINSQLVKTPAFRDTDVKAGKNYSYSVSAVDVRGNESARSEVASESVP